jgi:hypothetical protein
MKKLLATVLTLALIFIAMLPREPKTTQEVQKTQKTELTTKSTSVSSLKIDRSQLMRVTEEEDTPFWFSAIVPEPLIPRLPTAAAIRGVASAPDAALKTAARLREIESAPATPENLQLYNDQAVVFYNQDPVAATEWLNQTAGYDHLGPALASIATSLAERGRLDIAHLILENHPDPATRRSAVLDIYALRARNGQVTRADLDAAGWEKADIEHIFTERGD